MKILYIITKSNWGGAQRHVYDLAIHCRQNGLEPVVALGGVGILNDRLMEQNIPTRSISSMKRDVNFMDDTSSFREIFSIIRREKPDILHLHSSKAGVLGALAGRMLRVKKIIFTAHGWAFNENRPVPQRLAIAFVSWITMLLVTDIITISKKEFRQTQLFPLISKKLHMIYLGIAPPKFFSLDSAKLFLQSKTPEPLNKRTIIGTIAELHPNKGLIYAIEAMEKIISNFPVIYFIISDGEQKEFLEKIIKDKKMDKNIILTGYVENAVEYLKGFSIFLLPSVKEGLPYTLIEAGFAGLPVVTTAVGGIPEIIDDMKSGIIIQPKKSQEIAHSLEFLLKHKNIQREYGRTLNEKVRGKFNLENMIAKTMDLYKSPQKPQQPTPQSVRSL